MPEESLSKIHTGSLLGKSETVMQAEESDLRYTSISKTLTYTQQLMDQRWKAKRLSILKRDNYTCISCSSKNNLHVHHLKYTGFAWEAPDTDLVTVCNTCHQKIHDKPVQVKHTNLGKFHMSYNYTLRKAIDLSGEAFITIAKLITEVENENQIFIKQSVMAKQFGISRFTFMRHLNRAKELGLIEPDPKEGDSTQAIHLWRICPFLVWKGDRNALDRYIATLPKDHAWLTKWKTEI